MSNSTRNATRPTAFDASPSSSPDTDALLLPMSTSIYDCAPNSAYEGTLNNVAAYYPPTPRYAADVNGTAAYLPPVPYSFAGAVNSAMTYPSGNIYGGNIENTAAYYPSSPRIGTSVEDTVAYYPSSQAYNTLTKDTTAYHPSSPTYLTASDDTNHYFPSTPAVGAATNNSARPVADGQFTTFGEESALGPNLGPHFLAKQSHNVAEMPGKSMEYAKTETTSINDAYLATIPASELLEHIDYNDLPPDFPFEQFGLMKEMQNGMLDRVDKKEVAAKAGCNIFSANDVLGNIKKEAQELDAREEALVKREIAVREGEDRLEVAKMEMLQAKSAFPKDTVTCRLPHDKIVALYEADSRHAKDLADLNQVIRGLEYNTARDEEALDFATQKMDRLLVAVNLEEAAVVKKKELDPRSKEFRPAISTPSYSSSQISVIHAPHFFTPDSIAKGRGGLRCRGLVVLPENKEAGTDNRAEQAFNQGNEIVVGDMSGLSSGGYGNSQDAVAGGSSKVPLASHGREGTRGMWMMRYGQGDALPGQALIPGKKSSNTPSAGRSSGGYGNSQYGAGDGTSNGLLLSHGAKGADAGAKTVGGGGQGAGQAFNQGNNSSARGAGAWVNISGSCRK